MMKNQRREGDLIREFYYNQNQEKGRLANTQDNYDNINIRIMSDINNEWTARFLFSICSLIIRHTLPSHAEKQLLLV